MSGDEDLKESLIRWQKQPILESCGVITGCTRNQEWLLPWWWMNFQLHNSEYPITFFDLGDMTAQGKEWCKKRGRFESLSTKSIESFIQPRTNVSNKKVTSWEGHKNLNVWEARLAWFKKPFACLSTPFDKTLWIDLDCQVRNSLAPLFGLCDSFSQMSLVKEPDNVINEHYKNGDLLEGEKEYNSGVIAFKHGASLIQRWAKKILEDNHILRGDQEVITRLLFTENIKIFEIPKNYVQRAEFYPQLQKICAVDPSNIVLHWCGTNKMFIRIQMDFLKERCLLNLEY